MDRMSQTHQEKKVERISFRMKNFFGISSYQLFFFFTFRALKLFFSLCFPKKLFFFFRKISNGLMDFSRRRGEKKSFLFKYSTTTCRKCKEASVNECEMDFNGYSPFRSVRQTWNKKKNRSKRKVREREREKINKIKTFSFIYPVAKNFPYLFI